MRRHCKKRGRAAPDKNCAVCREHCAGGGSGGRIIFGGVANRRGSAVFVVRRAAFPKRAAVGAKTTGGIRNNFGAVRCFCMRGWTGKIFRVAFGVRNCAGIWTCGGASVCGGGFFGGACRIQLRRFGIAGGSGITGAPGIYLHGAMPPKRGALDKRATGIIAGGGVFAGGAQRQFLRARFFTKSGINYAKSGGGIMHCCAGAGCGGGGKNCGGNVFRWGGMFGA